MAFWVHGLFQYKYDEKSAYVAKSDMCLSVFSANAGKYGKNANQKNYEYGHFLRSVFQNFLYRNFHNYERYKRMQPHSNSPKHRYGTVQLLNLKLQRSMYIIFQACYLQLHFFKMMRKIYQMMLSHYLQIFQQKKQSTIHFISQLRAKLNVAQFSNVRFA